MNHRVLIVDDSATARMLIQRCFEIAGWQDALFFQAGDGQEALDTLGREKIDLVLTDLNMPNLDGEQFLHAVRKDAKYADMPVIMITSTSNEARRQQLTEAGANVVLPKPVSPPALGDAIRSLFGDVDG
jgi:two-component system, chemotaxis family, chemotaxis protein CheY